MVKMVRLVEMVAMVERIVRRLDPQGRVAIPADWRHEWKSDRVVLTRVGKKVELTPVEPMDPTRFVDSIPVSDTVDFTDPHSLRRAVLSRQKGRA